MEYSTLTHTHTHLAPTNGSLVVLASEEGNTCRLTFSKNFKDTLELLEMVKWNWNWQLKIGVGMVTGQRKGVG